MIKLIRLEWKKNNILKYILKAAIATGVLMLFIFLNTKDLMSDEMFEIYGKSPLIAVVDLFMNVSYILFTGVMIAVFIVGAYEKKMMDLMFSYPIKRQKILLSKIAAVWIFNFVAIVLSKLGTYLGLILVLSFIGFGTESISFGMLSFWLDLVFGSAAMVSISFIALPVGLKMKSSKAAIVAAVVIICFTQGNIGSATLVNNVPFYAILFVIAVVSIYLSICNVETKDLL